LNAILPSSPFYALRVRLLRLCGVRVEGNVRINTRVSLYWHNLSLGENTWVGPECTFSSTPEAGIKIGANCDIAPQVTFVTGTHELGSERRRAGKGKSLPIVVGDGCWIGARAVILGGATIGKGCVIGAGSVVVSGEYPANTLIAGVPARVKKPLAVDQPREPLAQVETA